MKNGRQPPRKWLDGMLTALAHRGPDGRGEWAGDTTVLLHTRLAIIDPEGGAQPLFGNNSVLVGNGEIYNYRELNRQRNCHDDHSGSDFECVLRTPPDDFSQFRGMYALARVESDGSLVLARDRYGIKPIYVADTVDFFAFASLPSALRVLDGVDGSLLPEAVTELLQQGWVTGRRTVYRGIARLMPGEVIATGGASRIATLPKAARRSNMSFDEAVKIFDRKFSESIELHQRSDVPYGLFLSGGIDSSAVLTMMARQNTAPVIAFTCGFDGTAAADERPRARDFAKALGAKLRATVLMTLK
jgi:asparagine synthase (glutamine-hydrolysing)